MAESHHNRRLLAVAAATCISLACGTNYAYSAWAPQFAERLQLSATQSNLIGAAANMGMYASGIPWGIVVDKKGPHVNIVVGSFVMSIGYWFLRKDGPESISIFWLCLFSSLSGSGGCAAFQAAIKTAALNWPHHRGTATAFPLAAFGLSALVFTSISAIFFPDSTSGYLLMLCIGTFSLVFFPVFFIHVPRGAEYQALASSERQRRDSNALIQPQSRKPRNNRVNHNVNGTITVGHHHTLEEEQLLYSGDEGPGDIDDNLSSSKDTILPHPTDITGLQLLKTSDFYLLFMMLGLLTGIGLMTINNIGHNSNALWHAYAPDTDPAYITRSQLMHVSIISCFSFIGRLLSGIGSDFLVKSHHQSRFWMLVVSSSILALAQVAALLVTSPLWLWIISSLSGIGYGILFGVYPALVADAFGPSGLAANWGLMTMSPMLWGNLFSLLYGMVYDSHTVPGKQGELFCSLGIDCYKNAYLVTTIVAVVGIFGALAAVARDTRKMGVRPSSLAR